MIKKHSLRVLGLFICICLLTTMITVNGEGAAKGTYYNDAYQVDGLRNPDGSLVEGINYTPLYYYGWLPSVMGDYYQHDKVAEELKLIKRLGFNSIRLLGTITENQATADNFDTYLDKVMKNYQDMFDICREVGLTATVIMIPGLSDYSVDYKSEDSGIYKILREFVTRFDKAYRDVVVMWEIANEPDLNTWGLKYDAEVREFATNEKWNNEIKPYLTWANGVVKALGAEIPTSIGAMNSARCDSWDAETFDVMNLHNYRTTMDHVTTFNNQAFALDQKTLGKVRPYVMTEVAMPGSMRQPNSDIMQYARENNIAYYVWGFAAVSFEQTIQGIVDTAGNMRASTLPFETLMAYPRQYPLAVPSFDVTAGGSDVDNTPLWAALRGLNNQNNLEYFVYGAEELYNFMRAIVPYYTYDFREAVYLAEGSTVQEKILRLYSTAAQAIMPYVRTYGNYTNDNILGGTLRANYHEKLHSQNTVNGFSMYRSRYAFEKGKGGSDGIVMMQLNYLQIRQALAAEKTYTLSADIRPEGDGWGGLAIAMADDVGEKQPACLQLRLTTDVSEAAASGLSGRWQKPYTVVAYLVNEAGGGRVREFSFDSSLAGEDGYVNLAVTFSGNGTAENPLSAAIKCGGTEIGRVTLDTGLSADCRYTALISSTEGAVNYYDNLILKDETAGEILLSDAFETGRYDFDLLTYDPELCLLGDGINNQDILDSLALMVSKSGNTSVLFTKPKNVEAHLCDSLLTVTWDYAGKGEAGFEIQRSLDGKTWERYWRTMPGMDYAVIPVYDEYAALYQYRVSPVTSTNTATQLSEPVKASLGKGQEGDVLASFENAAGETKKVVSLGTAVILEGSGSEVTVGGQFYGSAYFKMTSTKAVLTNPRLDKTAQTPGPSQTETPLTGRRTGLLAAAAVAVVLSTLSLGMGGLAAYKVRRKKRT